jgi:uncharacterized OsmC-like protein
MVHRLTGGAMSDTERIGKALQGAVEYLTENPGDAKATDSEAVAVLDGGLRVTVRDPSGRTVQTDMVTSVGGEDSAPSAGWLFRAAIASCDVTLIAMRAAMLGVQLGDVQVAVDSESDDQGILGIDESVPAGPLSMRTRVKVTAQGVDEKSLRELVEWAIAHCPVCDATKRAVPMTIDIDIG